MDFFEYENYLDIVQLKLRENTDSRGYNLRISEAAGFHPSHLSHVLAGRSLLTSDQALALADFWKFSQVETDYFLCLLELNRAGTERLRQRLQSRIELIRQDARRFSVRIVSRDPIERIELSLEDSTVYYGTWYYLAIHCMLVSKPFRTAAALAKQLQISESAVEAALETLEKFSLVSFDETAKEWRSITAVKHTDAFDHRPFVSSAFRAYTNFRKEFRDPDDLSLTIIAPVLKSNLPTLRQIIKDAVRDIGKICTDSQSLETDSAFIFCSDLFEV